MSSFDMVCVCALGACPSFGMGWGTAGLLILIHPTTRG